MNYRTTLLASLLVMSFQCKLAIAGPSADLWISDVEGRLGKVNLSTGNLTYIGTAGGLVFGDIAFRRDGKLFAVGVPTGYSTVNLYEINPTNGKATIIGSTDNYELNSLTFDTDGTLYSASNALYTINTSTGKASLVGSGEPLTNLLAISLL